MKVPDYMKKKRTEPLQFKPSTEPFWVMVPDSLYYTCVEPAGGPFVDPAVLRAIHSFDPGAIPVWEIRQWRAPYQRRPINVARIWIGRYNPTPNQWHIPFKVHMPTRAKHPRPNILDLPLFLAQPQGGLTDPIPFDWRTYGLCRTSFLSPDKAIERYEERQKERLAEEERRARHEEQEAEYFNRHLQKILDRYDPSELDWAAYRGKYERAARKRSELNVEGNPFIHVRGAA